MAKKKKSALPAVSRGFATTSIAKKPQPVVEAEPASPEAVEQSDASGGASNGATGPSGATGGAVENGAAGEKKKDDGELEDWEKEESYLQGLVEKLQDKVEKEVARGLKNIDFEKRQAKGFPRFEIPELIKERALELVQVEEAAEHVPHPIAAADSDKALLRLAITHGILVRLGYSSARVEECLRALDGGWELEDALDWIHLHCSEEEVLLEGDFAPNTEPTSHSTTAPVTPATPAHAPTTPRTDLTPPPLPSPSLSSIITLTPPNLVTKALASAPSTAASKPVSAAPSPETKAIRSSLLATGDDDSSSDSEGDEPNTEYAKLRIRLDELLGNLGPKGKKQKKVGKIKAGANKEPEEAFAVRKRMAEVKVMYFFGEKEADTEYRALKQKVEADLLEARLSGKELPTPPSVSVMENVLEADSGGLPDLLDGLGLENEVGDGEGGLEGLFAATETDTSNGTLITVRPMPFPKSYGSSAPTPKSSLQALVVKLDKFSVVDYTPLSGSFRATRVALKIRWSSAKQQEWRMEDLGCHSLVEAENYIATLALHELTVVESKGDKSIWRTLPPAFRDLWDELDEKRKEIVDKERRTTWAMLRGIVEAKMAVDEGNAKAQSKNASKLIPGFEGGLPPPPPPALTPLSEDQAAQIRASFERRQSSPAYQTMLEQRAKLPIAAYREQIVNALEESQILVLSGETGCGKSTQLPSFLLEDQLSKGKPCKIYVTEPRRISAISLAARVSQELGDSPNQVGTMSSLVGYSIRLESCISKNTRLAFVTNGIALRMLEGGSMPGGGKGTAFDEITHIIVDEVHERSIESDFLLIVLKTLLAQRKDLKVVLMSATVDAEKISNFFGGCPTLSVPGRTFPVNTFFLEDAIEYSKWHINGESPYARRYGKFQKGRPAKLDWNEDVVVQQADDDDDEDGTKKPDAPVKLEKKYGSKTVSTVNFLDDRLIPYDLIVRLLEKLCFEDKSYERYSASILIFLPGMNEIRRLNDLLQDHDRFGSNSFVIYPLHSSVSSEGQSAVFNTPPPGVRKIVISTNIAETGVTIPDVVCVIDSGKHREMRFDEKRQISKLVETWIAKSNAAQRRGRAGRVQEGLAFHLFTKLRHETQLQDHPLPEMLRLSLQDLALRIKILKIKIGSTIEEVLSRALDPPLPLNIQRAVSSLVEVKALTSTEDITPMGRLLSKLPMDVHLGKFLLIAALFKCLDPALTIAATLNSKSPFVAPFGLEQEADRAKLSFKTENSDFLTLHNAFSSWRRASANSAFFVRQYCRKNYLSHQNLQQIEELRQQLFSYLVDSGFVTVSDEQRNTISRARFSRKGFRFVPIPAEFDVNSNDTHMISAALAAGLFPKILSVDPQNGSLRTFSNNQPASIHPSSVNFRVRDFGSNHLAFFTIMHSKKLYAWETGPVDDRALLMLCGDVDFKLAASSLQLDRKIKHFVAPKTLLALKHLRAQLSSILATRMRGKEMTAEQLAWWELAMELLGREKLSVEEGGIAATLGVVATTTPAPR